jgi:hypothetical protein
VRAIDATRFAYENVATPELASRLTALTGLHAMATEEAELSKEPTDKLRQRLNVIRQIVNDRNAGKDVRLNLENVRRTLSDLEARLESRKKELQSMRHVTSATPVALSGALVIPAGLLRTLRGDARHRRTPSRYSSLVGAASTCGGASSPLCPTRK